MSLPLHLLVREVFLPFKLETTFIRKGSDIMVGHCCSGGPVKTYPLTLGKLDGVGLFDNRPSTDKLHHFVHFFKDNFFIQKNLNVIFFVVDI